MGPRSGGPTPYTTMLCATVPSRPPSIVVITVCGGIALPFSSDLVCPLPLVPPPTSCTTSVPTTRPARIEVRRDCGWWHVVLRTLHRADMSTPMTIEQNRQSVRQHSGPRTQVVSHG